MVFKEQVEKLLNQGLMERPDLFLVDFEVNDNNGIRVVIDGDNGVLVEDCMFISRAIEHNLDREEQDFSLEVTSAGATSPLEMPRQFKKNIGRKLGVVTTTGEKYEADLLTANDDKIVITWKAREPKPVGKGKITVTKEVEIGYQDIKEAKVKIKF